MGAMSDFERKVRAREEAAKEAKEDAELEAKIAQKLRNWKRATMCLGFALLANIAAVVPFLAGHSLHKYWGHVGKYMVRSPMFLLLAFCYAAQTAYNMHRSLRDVKKINKEYPPGSDDADG
jgi:hypothetical protein